MDQDLKRDLAINENDLDWEVIRQAGLYAHYHAQLVDARRQYKKLKLSMDIYEAALYQQIRDMSISRGQKPTEKHMEMEIKRNPDWRTRASELIEWEASIDQLDGILRALAQKKDMLVTHSTNIRAERGSIFNTRKEAHQERGPIPVGPVSPAV